MEDYQRYLNKTEEELKEDMKPNAEREVRTELVLKAVAKAEGIEATEEDMDAEISRIAEMYSQDVETVRGIFAQQETLPLIAKDLQMKKAVEFLIENAVPVAPKEAETVEE
jgi:trigger factor